MRNILILLLFTLISYSGLSQSWSADGICDFTDGGQWNSGGAKGCACTWYTVSGTDTILNCAFGDCGQNALYECIYDCNGHNGYTTQSIPRTCDATASPICWVQGAGSAGELFCLGLTLPIELGDFWGSSTEQGNELNWTTISEMDNDYFEISYSTHGTNFNVLGVIDGAGTTQLLQNYRFIHTNPLMGVGYYKIRQVDYNGESDEFPIIVINNEFDGTTLFSDIFPNPSTNIFYFNYGGDNISIPLTVKVITTFGEIIREGIVDKYNNSQAIPFDLNGVSQGVYLVEISQGDMVEVKRVLVR